MFSFTITLYLINYFIVKEVLKSTVPPDFLGGGGGAGRGAEAFKLSKY